MAEAADGWTGAHRGADGLDGVDTYMANVGLMPVEVAESSYSVRILRTELIAGSQGDGLYRGDLGLRRDYQVDQDGRPVPIGSKASLVLQPTDKEDGRG